MANQTFTAGAAVTINAMSGFSAPTVCYTFDGWATALGGAMVYGPGATLVAGTLTGPTTLYAHWVASNCTLTFSAGSTGSGTMASQTFTAGGTFTINAMSGLAKSCYKIGRAHV